MGVSVEVERILTSPKSIDTCAHCVSADGTGEFLDAWLVLVEKMVNTKNILESPHTLPPKTTSTGSRPFDALQYLIKTQKVRA